MTPSWIHTLAVFMLYLSLEIYAEYGVVQTQCQCTCDLDTRYIQGKCNTYEVSVTHTR